MTVEWECLGCTKLNDDTQIVMLSTGKIVCNTCRPAQIERDAQTILSLASAPDIVPALHHLAFMKGRDYAEEVRMLMLKLWRTRN
jgi:hypothetical protein